MNSEKGKIIIREAVWDDLSDIDAIYNQAIFLGNATADREAYSHKEREQWFCSHSPESFPVYVAEQAGKVIGYVSLSPYRPRRKALRHTVEVSYFVHEDSRGRGVGSVLLEKAIMSAGELGYKHIIAILISTNFNSQALLTKFGFGEWGRMKDIVEINQIPDAGETWADHLYFGLSLG